MKLEEGSDGNLREAEMRLDDDIQAACAYEAVCARKGQIQLAHDFGDADGGGTRDADAAVDECRCASSTALG